LKFKVGRGNEPVPGKKMAAFFVAGDCRFFGLAKSALEKAAALAGDNPAVLQLRFKFCWQTEDYPAAREIMLRLNQIAPGDEHAYWLSEVEKKLKTASQPLTNIPSNPEN
jgi:hypothetical protein